MGIRIGCIFHFLLDLPFSAMKALFSLSHSRRFPPVFLFLLFFHSSRSLFRSPSVLILSPLLSLTFFSPLSLLSSSLLSVLSVNDSLFSEVAKDEDLPSPRYSQDVSRYGRKD